MTLASFIAPHSEMEDLKATHVRHALQMEQAAEQRVLLLQVGCSIMCLL